MTILEKNPRALTNSLSLCLFRSILVCVYILFFKTYFIIILSKYHYPFVSLIIHSTYDLFSLMFFLTMSKPSHWK